MVIGFAGRGGMGLPQQGLISLVRRRPSEDSSAFLDHFPLWRVTVLTVLLRHTTTEACLAELRSNAGLRRLIGIRDPDGVPKKWNMSRFQAILGSEPHLSLLQEMFNIMVQRLGGVVKQLGRHTAGDATGLSARPPRGQRGASELDQPTGGRKEYTDMEGRSRTQAARARRQQQRRLRRGRDHLLLRHGVGSPGAAGDGVHWPREVAGDAEVSLPGLPRGLPLPQPRALQRGQTLRQDGPGQAGDRPAPTAPRPAQISRSVASAPARRPAPRLHRAAPLARAPAHGPQRNRLAQPRGRRACPRRSRTPWGNVANT